MSNQYGRTFNEARKAQGFTSQANLDAFFRHYDHSKTCAECQKPGPGVLLDDGYQPTMNSCPEHQELYKAYINS